MNVDEGFHSFFTIHESLCGSRMNTCSTQAQRYVFAPCTFPFNWKWSSIIWMWQQRVEVCTSFRPLAEKGGCVFRLTSLGMLNSPARRTGQWTLLMRMFRIKHTFLIDQSLLVNVFSYTFIHVIGCKTVKWRCKSRVSLNNQMLFFYFFFFLETTPLAAQIGISESISLSLCTASQAIF